jgi:hypothetical protein
MVEDREAGLAVLAPRGPLDLPAVGLYDQLVAVAYPQQRDVSVQEGLVGMRGGGRVDAGGSSGEDDAGDPEPLQLLQRGIVPEEGGVDTEPPDPSAD